MGEHKGSAITMLIELMAGLLTGAGYGKQVAWQYDETAGKGNVGHIFCAINPVGFMDIEEIRIRMDSFYDEIKAMPKATGYDSIRLPGEGKRDNLAKNTADGILLNDTLYNALLKLGNDYNVKMPETY
jgi:LDH2 family malate/lactate/ureidoglycolate dehydrogenase